MTHVVKGLSWHHMEDPGDFLDAIVLCHSEAVDEALLPHPSVPNRSPVHEHGDHQGIVHLAPVEEVKAPDRVAEDADPVDGGAGAVGHDFDVRHPLEVPLEENPKELKLVDGGDVLWAGDGVSILGANGAPPHSCAFLFGEGHELCLGRISLEAILVEPLQDLLIMLDSYGGGGMFSGGGGINGAVVNV